MCNSFAERQDKIISGYSAKICRADSILNENRRLIMADLSAKDSTPYLHLPDIEDRLAREEQLLEAEETKHILDMELSKIQQEYETLNLWGAILTIVFLIFSFYSLYKSDEIARQSSEAFKEISKIKIEAEKHKNDIADIPNRIETDANKRLSEIEKKATDNLSSLSQNIENEKKRLSDSAAEFEARNSKTISDEKENLRKYIESISKDTKADFNDTLRKTGEEADRLNKMIANLKSEISDLYSRLDDLIKEVDMDDSVSTDNENATEDGTE